MTRLVAILSVLSACRAAADDALIVLAAPEREGYYSSVYRQIVDFQISFAKKIQQGSDSVLILTGPDLYPLYEAELGAEVLVNNKQQADIWMRDFTTVNPTNPVQFNYAPAAQGGNAGQSRYVQSTFNSQVLSQVQPTSASWMVKNSELVLDGGNFVDNHVNRAIVSEKILEDVGMDPMKAADRSYAKQHIRSLIPQITEVAIIPYDDPNLGHADGMVMWVDEDTLFVNKNDDPSLRTPLMQELRDSFPTVTIVEVTSGWVPGTDFDKLFSSALGININSVMTKRYLYVPVFGMTAIDKEFLATLAKHTTKEIVTIDASGVARMGGSCRCLSWQTSGPFASDIIKYLKPVTTSSNQPISKKTTPTPPPSSSDDDSLPLFALILIIIGGSVTLLVAAVVVYVCCFRDSKEEHSDSELQQYHDQRTV